MRHILMLMVSFCFFQTAHGFYIYIDVDDFAGAYMIDNTGPHLTGSQSVNVAQGSHTLDILMGGSVNFSVDGSGNVTSGDPVVLSGAGTVLAFNNVDVDFDTSDYNQPYIIGCYGHQYGSNSFRIPTGIDVALSIPFSTCQVVGKINVHPDGYVAIIDGHEAFSGQKNLVTFKSIPVNVDSQMYQGVYAFLGGTDQVGPTTQYFLPNATYTMVNESGGTLATFDMGLTEIIPTSNGYFRAKDSTIQIYSNRYHVYPPGGYTDSWQLYGHAVQYDEQDVWIMPGGASTLTVDSVVYPYTATSDCTGFSVTTAYGDFYFDCDPEAPIHYSPLHEDILNDINYGFALKRFDGRLSQSIGDYTLEVNGVSNNLANASLTRDTLYVPDAFVQGRNYLDLNGEDSDSNPFWLPRVFWAGSAEVTVITENEDDTIQLTVTQHFGMTSETIDIVQQATDYKVVFKNVPQLNDGIISIATRGKNNKKVFKTKIPRTLEVRM